MSYVIFNYKLHAVYEAIKQYCTMEYFFINFPAKYGKF